jgi:hypothetical protein
MHLKIRPQQAQQASQTATEVAKLASVAAAEAVKEVETELQVIQVIQHRDGTMAVTVTKTGVNLQGGQTAVWSGLTDAPTNSSAAWRQGGKEQAISEAEATTGLDVYDVAYGCGGTCKSK